MVIFHSYVNVYQRVYSAIPHGSMVPWFQVPVGILWKAQALISWGLAKLSFKAEAAFEAMCDAWRFAGLGCLGTG